MTNGGINLAASETVSAQNPLSADAEMVSEAAEIDSSGYHKGMLAAVRIMNARS